MPPKRKKVTKRKKAVIPELQNGVPPQKITKSKDVIKEKTDSCRSLRPRQGKNFIKEENCDFGGTSMQVCEDLYYGSGASSAVENNLEDSDYEEITNERLLEDYNLLQSLQKQEEDLKIAILYEKLKKEEHLITDEDFLLNSISVLKNEIVKKKEDFKAKNTMYPHIQLSEIMQELLNLQNTENKSELSNFSKEEKKIMLDLLLKRKELNKEISREQLEITDYEEKCLELRLTIDNTIKALEQSKQMETLDPNDEEELKQLEKDNRSRSSRIQLLAKIVKVLIDNIKEKKDLIDLNKLSSACEKILKWNYEDIDEIEDLCKAVYSTNI